MQLERRAEVDGGWIYEARRWEEQLAELVLERSRLLPQTLEPGERVLGDRLVVAGDAKLEVAVKARPGGVRRRDEHHAGVLAVGQQVGLPVHEAGGVAAYCHLGAIKPALDRLEQPRATRGRKAGEVALAAQALELEAEAIERDVGAERWIGGSADDQPHRAPLGEARQLVEPPEVDVAGGDRERVTAVVVIGQKRERPCVTGLGVEVVDQLRWALRHAYPSARCSAECRHQA